MLSHPTGGATLGTSNTTVNIAGAYATVAPPFDTALTIRREWGANVLTWAGGGQLLRADKLTGPWQTLSAVTNPCTVQSPVPTTFYRVTLPRPVSVYIPSSYDSKTNLPLVILLHGAGGDGVWEESYMQFQPLAEARGFLYCCPDGTFDRSGGRYWNGVGVDDFWNEQVNDAGYLRAVIEQIGQQFALDRKRVYLIGFSAGGDMSYEAACKSADLIAGIATLAGVTYLDPVSCQPSEPVNVLCICGTEDELGCYYGGSWGLSSPLTHSPAYPGAVRTVQIWAGYNGARQPVMDPAPTLDLIANVNGLDTVVTRYTEAVRGGAVELWTIKRGQHTPPLSSQFAPLIIEWLLAHPKP
jgi:polyhydroxybutyrate depolymerase